MSVSRWAYIPERCDGEACPGDCDLCSKAHGNVALMENDTIYRQAALEEVHGAIYKFFDICDDDEESPMTYKDKKLLEINKAITIRIKQLPSAHRPVDEWCTDCKEYDTERKCCPRFNRVIRSAVDERKHGRWIDLRQEGDSRFMCSVCKWKEHVPTCMGKPTVWEYCPSCGARMDGDGNG